MRCFGYCFNKDGTRTIPVRLDGQDAVIMYIRENLEAHQVVITDQNDQQLLHLRDGVDLYNALDQIGISLNEVYGQIRDEIVEEQTHPEKKPEWEKLYDQIGLSPGEIRMRQRVKAACRAAQTVADVAEIVRGSYFDAHFLTPDGKKWYRFFDEEDYSATLMTKDENGKWVDEPKKVILSPTSQVRHLRSSEDIHTFEILE